MCLNINAGKLDDTYVSCLHTHQFETKFPSTPYQFKTRFPVTTYQFEIIFPLTILISSKQDFL